MEGDGADVVAKAQTAQKDNNLERRHDDDNDEEEIEEVDPGGRYQRFAEVVGHGRFKVTSKAFDTNLGIDVAWSKISTASNHLDASEVRQLVDEMQKGLFLDHPHIIKCFKCWEDREHQTINLITELFTSGNLRQYRKHHPTLDHKALKRMARQILQGLQYLHNQPTPVYHGDLRCDKIYVNGNAGEIKIGDLGLATLLNKCHPDNQSPLNSRSAAIAEGGSLKGDVFDFGLCMFELLTLEKVTSTDEGSDWSVRVESMVQDPLARDFLMKCLQPSENPVTASQLLEHAWLLVKKTNPPAEPRSGMDAVPETQFPEGRPDLDRMSDQIATGQLRGEDYKFQIQGRVRGGKMNFRLVMQPEDEDADAEQTLIRTIDFEFDPETDTIDNIASEIGHEFNLSTTDTEICASVLREFLAREMPDTCNQ